ncbi:helix-turn-helix domain-containing protein [Georgenia sp. H159]|uniref:helix-turn-helix domain-containing protein n=1 Tax=Georgenia sp. H159 TaxID=3076115 RepID=UPI002D76E388|nr:helix-turn-helix domain-containing protein [Georgenia sp. H159]
MATMTKLGWQKALRGADLTPTEYMVLSTLATYTDRHMQNAHPGWTRLVADTHLDLRTIKRAATSLIDKGYLILVEAGGNQVRKGAANVYAVTLPKGDIQWPPSGGLDSDGSVSTHGGLTEYEVEGVHPMHPRGTSGAAEGVHPVPPHQVLTSGPSSSSTSVTAYAATATPIGLPNSWHPTHSHLVQAENLGVDLSDATDEFTLQMAHEKRKDWNRTFSEYLKACEIGTQYDSFPIGLLDDESTGYSCTQCGNSLPTTFRCRVCDIQFKEPE